MGIYRELTEQEKKEYDELTKNMQQAKLKLEEFENRQPVVYGYCRVSSKRQEQEGNSLQAQEEMLRANGATVIYKETFTGKTTDRPVLDELVTNLKSGDTLMACKLDRIARSLIQGSQLIQSLLDQGITIHILNMGKLDRTTTGNLLTNILFCVAEFERNLIIERTNEGKAIARTKAGFREGRKPVYTECQLEHALELLKDNTYKRVSELTGISKATLYRAKIKREGESLLNESK